MKASNPGRRNGGQKTPKNQVLRKPAQDPAAIYAVLPSAWRKPINDAFRVCGLCTSEFIKAAIFEKLDKHGLPLPEAMPQGEFDIMAQHRMPPLPAAHFLRNRIAFPPDKVRLGCHEGQGLALLLAGIEGMIETSNHTLKALYAVIYQNDFLRPEAEAIRAIVENQARLQSSLKFTRGN